MTVQRTRRRGSWCGPPPAATSWRSGGWWSATAPSCTCLAPP